MGDVVAVGEDCDLGVKASRPFIRECLPSFLERGISASRLLQTQCHSGPRRAGASRRGGLGLHVEERVAPDRPAG